MAPVEISIKQVVDRLIASFHIEAVIFDLDGTLVDNNAIHLQAWKRYLQNAGIDINEEAYRININGRTNKDALEYIYNRRMTEEEAMVYALEKEAVYREIYKPIIQPVPGLPQLLAAIHDRDIPMAIATSGIQVNIDFMFDNIPIRPYFKQVVNSSHIRKGKPDPEIFLKTASLLEVVPAYCLVFEDAVVGIMAAHAAGMKAIALTTTQTAAELKEAEMIIRDFRAGSFFL